MNFSLLVIIPFGPSFLIPQIRARIQLVDFGISVLGWNNLVRQWCVLEKKRKVGTGTRIWNTSGKDFPYHLD
jgi:hypothetical protein